MEPKNLEKLKKGLIYSTFVIVFGVVMWIIFAPKSASAKEENAVDSLASLPEPTTTDFFDDKMSIYDKFNNQKNQDSIELASQNSLDSLSKIHSIDGYDFTISDNNNFSAKQAMGDLYDITENTQRYREQERTIERLKEDNNQLSRRLNQLEYEKSQYASTKELFRGNGSSNPSEVPVMELAKSNATERDIVPPSSSFIGAKKKVIKIELDKKENVSVLGVDKSEVGTNSFNSDLSAKKPKNDIEQNTIKAVIDHTITVKDGDIVPLRLKQSVKIDDIYYPKNTIVYGLVNIGNNRLNISISKLEIDNNIYDTDLVVYDNDGQLGLYVPVLNKASLTKDLSKGVGNSTQSTSSSISITGETNPMRQLQSDATRGVISGISNFIQNKLNEVKVTLKGGYNVFIMSNKN